MQDIPCNHCHRDSCRLCFLYANDERYRKLWSAPARQRDPNKPRVNITDLAQQRRH